MRFSNHLRFAGVLTMLALGASLNAQNGQSHINGDPAPTGKGGTISNPKHDEPAPGAGAGAVINKASSTGINYHGGPVLLGTVNIHFIYYGNWNANSTLTGAQGILAAWAQGLGGTPYHNIETTYFNGAGQHVSNSLHFSGAVTVGSSFGNAISDAQLTQIVASTNPTDTNGVYFVLTSPEVNETSGFCTQFCGFHTHATINGHDIKYSFVGDANGRCPASCSVQNPTPNGNGDADEMVNVMTHELEETISDPDLNAWFDRQGQENGDKCNFNFGATFTTGNGSQANQTFGGRNWLLQQNWLNSGTGGCVQRF